MMKIKNIFVLSLFCVLMIRGGSVFAGCSSTMLTAPELDVPDIKIPRNATVGQVLYSGSMTTRVKVADNNNGVFYIQLRYPGFGAYPFDHNGYPVYGTSVDGIGVAIEAAEAGTGLDIKTPNGFEGEFEQETKYYIIKAKAKVVPGSLSGRLFSLYYHCDGSIGSTSYGKDLSFVKSSVTVNACSLSNSSISVPLGPIPRNSFTGLGSSYGDREFDIPLVCDANTKVAITLDATPDNSGAPGVMKLDSSSSVGTASGVGVQLLHKNTPVAFGSPIAAGTSGAVGNYKVTLLARYYQTAAKISAGEANATATFVMTYN